MACRHNRPVNHNDKYLSGSENLNLIFYLWQSAGLIYHQNKRTNIGMFAVRVDSLHVTLAQSRCPLHLWNINSHGQKTDLLLCVSLNDFATTIKTVSSHDDEGASHHWLNQ